MSRGGARPGAGRPVGVPNKASLARQEAIAASGLTPLDYMLNVLRDDDAPRERRDWAAEKAAPYVHPRLAAVEHAGKDGGPIQVNISGDDAGLL
jgi:hypothetical protein